MEKLPTLHRGRIHLILADLPIRRELVNAAIARLAFAGPLLVLDGGNSFQAHRIARLLRSQTEDLNAVLNNIVVARAFTCYQVVSLLENTPATPVPTLVLELLDTFRDENVRLDERRRLLAKTIAHLRRLSSRAPLAVSVAPALTPDGEALLAALEDACAGALRMEPLPPPATQLSFFPDPPTQP